MASLFCVMGRVAPSHCPWVASSHCLWVVPLPSVDHRSTRIAPTLDPSNRELELSPPSVLPFLPPISPFMSLFLPPGPRFRRSRIPTRSAGNLGPDRKLYTTVLPPHMALCILLPSRHRPPSHLPHRRPIPL